MKSVLMRPTDSMFATLKRFMNFKSTKSVNIDAENILSQLYAGINAQSFENVVLATFHFQSKNLSVYRDFLSHLGINSAEVYSWKDIPFLPISFFKSHSVIVEGQQTKVTFESSGTTGMVSSKHLVAEPKVYEWSFVNGFKRYIHTDDLAILALLPNYIERGSSSLVYMVNGLIEEFPNPDSGFYLHNLGDLAARLADREAKGKPTLLLGVTYALLDLMEQFPMQLKHTTVMETGGMKGHRKEMIKEELHRVLKAGFGVNNIHSEYGMTELLSQAYSKGNNLFETPPWMKVVIRDTTDSFHFLDSGKTGGINVIDLANFLVLSLPQTI